MVAAGYRRYGIASATLRSRQAYFIPRNDAPGLLRLGWHHQGLLYPFPAEDHLRERATRCAGDKMSPLRFFYNATYDDGRQNVAPMFFTITGPSPEF